MVNALCHGWGLEIIVLFVKNELFVPVRTWMIFFSCRVVKNVDIVVATSCLSLSGYRCLFVGSKLKAMALTSFCHRHILYDAKQKLTSLLVMLSKAAILRFCTEIFYVQFYDPGSKVNSVSCQNHRFDNLASPSDSPARFPLMGELVVDKHVKYILSVEKRKDSFESVVLEHLRMNGVYWGLTTLDLLGKLDALDSNEVIQWIMKCQHESGGFAGNIGHDPHLLYTLSAVQVLTLFDKLNVLDADKVANYISGLQNEDGSFSGDEWGEVDTRFSYLAICCLSILHRLDKMNVEKAVNYIVSCKNVDGGFGCTPGGESHAGQIFCCVGALAITGSLHHVDKDLLGWWLCERQVKSGGLNGRPEKLPDVCYSWWVLSSLIMIDRVHWINKDKLVKFILNCQDTENGGISDRPEDAVDVFHTYFGVAGLSLLEYPGLKAIDPAHALPVDVVNRIFFQK